MITLWQSGGSVGQYRKLTNIQVPATGPFHFTDKWKTAVMRVETSREYILDLERWILSVYHCIKRLE
jgi:hypothetical protein